MIGKLRDLFFGLKTLIRDPICLESLIRQNLGLEGLIRDHIGLESLIRQKFGSGPQPGKHVIEISKSE